MKVKEYVAYVCKYGCTRECGIIGALSFTAYKEAKFKIVLQLELLL
jgi:hypothetical protein